MLESKQISEYDVPSNAFSGVRFVLFGFDSVREEEVRLKLFEGGGVDAVNYGPDCSHVIVDKIVYDDPICVAARRDDKILVTGLWVDHSWDVGIPVDPNSIMYRPVKDLNGIPGAKSLVMCLTGYQRHDREDIMNMVSLMGATFSKPLVANKVTHLICYKFEGEKYELGKKIKTMKLVNHHWLQDSLRAWQLLPEADYAKSGYELEMMEAEAKDSDDETEDVASVELKKKSIISPQNARIENKTILRSPEQGFSKNTAYVTAFESFSNVGNTSKTQLTPRKETGFGKTSFSRESHDERPGTSDSSCARSPAKISSKVPSNMIGGTLISEKNENFLASASESAKKSISGGLSKLSSKSMKASLPLSSERIEHNSRSPLSNASKPGLAGAISSDKHLGGADSHGIKTPSKGTMLHPDEQQTVGLSRKSYGSSRSPVLSHSPKALMRSGLATKPIEMTVSKSSIDGPCQLARDVSPTNRASCLREEVRGGSVTPLEKDQDGIEPRGVKTPLKAALYLDEDQTCNLPGKKTISGGGSRSKKLGHSPKILIGHGLDTKTMEMPVLGSSVEAVDVPPTNVSSSMREEVSGGLNTPSERDRDGIKFGGATTPSNEALPHPNEEETSSLPGMTKMTIARGSSKSEKLNLSNKTRVEIGVDMKAMERPVSESSNTASHLREGVSLASKEATTSSTLQEDRQECNEQTLQRSRGRPKNQRLPDLNVEGPSMSRQENQEMQQSDPLGFEPPFPSSSSRVEKLDGQTDHADSHSKPEKKTMLARKTLGSRPTIRKGSTTKYKGLISASLMNELTNHSNAAVAIEHTNTVAPVEKPVSVPPTTSKDVPAGDETEAPECEGLNDFDKGIEKSPEVEEPDSVKPTHKRKQLSEKTAQSKKAAKSRVKKKSNEATETVCSENTELPESRSTDGGAQEKVTEGKKHSLAKSKRAKSNDPTEENKQDEINRVSHNEEMVASASKSTRNKLNDPTQKTKQEEEKTTLAGKKSKRLSKKSKQSDDLEKENEPVAHEQQSVSGDTVAAEEEKNTALAGRKSKRPSKKSKGSDDLEKENEPVANEQQNVTGDTVAAEEEKNTALAGKKSKRPSKKSKQSDDLEKENEPVANEQQSVTVASEEEKNTAVAGKKSKRPSKKSKGSDDLEKENEPVANEQQSVSGDPVAAEEEKNTAVAGKKSKRPSKKSKRSDDPEKENEPVANEQQSVSGDPVAAEEEKNTALAGKKSKRLSEKSKRSDDLEKENEPVENEEQSVSGETIAAEKETSHKIKKPLKTIDKADKADIEELNTKAEPACFILSGHKLQRKEFQQVIKRLKGRVCRDSHNWSYQATHFIVPDPIRRTEKFFAAAASGSWILKTDYLTASNEAGRLLSEEPYEWHKKCLTEDGAINLEAPRKWRLLRERTGHGAFYGMRIIIYGECIAPPLDTLKRVVKAGDGTILATSPPYTRFLTSNVDFAIVSPGMPRVDMWVQEFLSHEIPCVSADYLVEYVCKPGYSLERHVQYGTQAWAKRSLENLVSRVEEAPESPKTPEDHLRVDDVACQVCGSRDRGEDMLICGDESGIHGCGVGSHIDCLDPPLEYVPEEDWFCVDCCRKREVETSGRSSKKWPRKSKK